MNELEIKEDKIKTMIYKIRNKEVMLDSDLAILYQVETKRINEAVRNNPDKFPDRFSWKLTPEEYLNLRSKISTSNWNNYGGRRYNPRVFTEQGVAMLATILKSNIAIKVSIAIMDAFVSMRHIINDNYHSINIQEELGYHSQKLIEHDEKIKLLFSKFNDDNNKKELLFFEGQIYDSYSKIVEIIKKAKKSLIIIDSYADTTILDIISKTNISVTLITKVKTLLSKTDIEKYNKQYNNLKIIYNDIFHDRFIIIDEYIIYHLGSSINHAGNKIFAINKIEDKEIIKTLVNKIKTIT